MIAQLARFPQVRWMGSKHRLLPWIAGVLGEVPFASALDLFSGSGAVAYLFKAMGKRVIACDFLNACRTLAAATVATSSEQLAAGEVAALHAKRRGAPTFIRETFAGIFYTQDDLAFLDRVCGNLPRLRSPGKRALALAALIRSCAKRQPRGVFTVAGDPERYKDGRRDLALSLEEHFAEQVDAYNAAVFDNGQTCRAVKSDAFAVQAGEVDLVYLDPPYVPRADDNCYMKRYHFLEGLSCYWKGVRIQEGSRVRKIEKPYTPFSYRKDAVDAFARLFTRFPRSTLALSYSSNGYPDLPRLVELLERTGRRVAVHARPHRYHFGTHRNVKRSAVEEYLLVARW